MPIPTPSAILSVLVSDVEVDESGSLDSDGDDVAVPVTVAVVDVAASSALTTLKRFDTIVSSSSGFIQKKNLSE